MTVSNAAEGFGVPVREKRFPLECEAFSASGIFRVPPGVYKIFVEVLGAGGGGGGLGNTGAPGYVAPGGCPSGGGGGGGHGAPGSDGGYGADYIVVVPGQEFAVTVGAGGGGGGTGSGGSTGGTSSFGDKISATGGAGGAVGGTGGTGQPGIPYTGYAIGVCGGGAGGSPGGDSEWNPSHGTSSARVNRTGGGSRGASFNGGTGQAGRVVVWYKKTV